MAEPFRFTSVVQLPEMLGRRARDEQELLELLEEVPIDSIYYHTTARFLRQEVLDNLFPNDFAAWAAREVRDQVLAERLGMVDPFGFDSLEAVRNEIVTIVDDHLSRIGIVPRVIFGEPFYFMRSRIIEVPTGLLAHDLATFEDAIARVDTGAIYFHGIETRFRKNTPEGDFAKWVTDRCECSDLGSRIAKLSPFASSLETMRRQLLGLVRDARGMAKKEEKAA